MSAAEIKFDRPLSLDNTGQHADRGAKLKTSFYKTSAATPMAFADYIGANGVGDNATFCGVGGLYVVAADAPGITAGQRGCLYPLALSVVPSFARNNTPFDDATCVILQNDGTAMATELGYVGGGLHNLDPCAIAAWGIEANFVTAIWYIGHAGHVIDCSRGLATPARIDHAFARIPPNTVAMQARNGANTGDINLLGIASDVVQLADKNVHAPAAYAPSVTAATGTLGTGATTLADHTYWSQINGRVQVEFCAYVPNVGTGAGDLLVGLPKTAGAGRGALYGHDTTYGWGVYAEILPGENVARCRYINSASPIVAGNFVFLSGSYRPATD